MITIYKGADVVYVQATEDLMKVMATQLRVLHGRTQTQMPFLSPEGEWIQIKQIEIWNPREDFLHGLAAMAMGLNPNTKIVNMVKPKPKPKPALELEVNWDCIDFNYDGI